MSAGSQTPLTDRVVLLTGATGGVGQALAVAFARAGATVVLHARIVRKLEVLFDRIMESGGPEPAILPLDFELAGSEAYSSAAEEVGHQFGRLDAIVHCAAMLKRLAPIEHHSPEDWAAVLKVNLSAPALLTRAMLPLLRQAPLGTVVFTLDSRGHRPGAYWGSYAAAKAGLEALVRVLGDEWESAPAMAAVGIIPGPIATPMRQRSHPGDDAQSLLPAEALSPLYIRCVAEGGPAWNGKIVDAQEWLVAGA